LHGAHPQPPFDCGSPAKAGAERVERVTALQAERVRSVEALIDAAAARL
jgi:cyclohexyl-isocyanide hydratase